LAHGVSAGARGSPRRPAAADELEAVAYHLGLVHSIGCTSDAHEAAAAFS
jgi:hypothetical protein